MKKRISKIAWLLSFVGLAAAQTGNAFASVDWSWSFEPAEMLFPENATSISVYATVMNSAQSTGALAVDGISLPDGSMGVVLFDSQGGGVLTPTVMPSNAQLVAPGESVTWLLFTLTSIQPLVPSEEYFASPYLYIGTNCSSIAPCVSWERELPTAPLHLTISAVPEPSVNGMLALGLLTLAIRAKQNKSQRIKKA